MIIGDILQKLAALLFIKELQPIDSQKLIYQTFSSYCHQPLLAHI
jgi:hypothetical protein